MDNTFIECMVRKEDDSMRLVKKIGMIIGVLLMNAAVLLIIPVGISVSMVVSFLIFFFFWRRIDREYEIIYTDGLMDFDVIYGRSSRRRLLSVDAKQFQFIVPAESEAKKNQVAAKYDKELNIGRTAEPNEKSYVGVVTKDEKTWKVIFEPNDRIVQALRRYIPNKFEMRR